MADSNFDLGGLADKLIKFWQNTSPDVWNQKGVAKDVVVAGLNTLLEGGSLTIAKLASTAAFGAEIATALEAIRKFQADHQLTPDGIWGRITSRAADGIRPFADNPKNDAKLTPETVAQKATGKFPNMLFYYVRPNQQPRGIDPSQSTFVALINEAWFNWQQHLNIAVKRVATEQEADLLVEMGQLDGTGPTLGLADVAGPAMLNRKGVKLTMDEAETWTREKFVAAASHELGHVLGLDHSSSPGQLMYGYMNSSNPVLTPQAEDIARAQKTWGAVS